MVVVPVSLLSIMQAPQGAFCFFRELHWLAGISQCELNFPFLCPI